MAFRTASLLSTFFSWSLLYTEISISGLIQGFAQFCGSSESYCILQEFGECHCHRSGGRNPHGIAHLSRSCPCDPRYRYHGVRDYGCGIAGNIKITNAWFVQRQAELWGVIMQSYREVTSKPNRPADRIAPHSRSRLCKYHSASFDKPGTLGGNIL